MTDTIFESSELPLSPVRRTLARIFACAAMVCMIFATRDFAAQKNLYDLIVFPRTFFPGLLFMLGAAYLFRLRIPQIPVTDSFPPITKHRWLKRLAVAVALVCTAVQIEINGRIFGIQALESVSHHVQFGMFIISSVLLVWGCSDRLPSWRNLSAAQRGDLLFVGIVTLVGLGMRLINLEALRAFVDEMNFLIPTMRFTKETDIQLLHPLGGIAAFPLLYPYLQSLALPYSDTVLIALRVPAAFFGAATLPPLYLLAKTFFGRTTARVAVILLATLPLHIHWSRLGMNNIADGLFGISALALIARGVAQGGRWHFALAGVCFGFVHYFYEGGRLTFTALILLWFFYLMPLLAWKALPRRYILLFAFTAFVTALPVYTTLMSQNASLTARYQEIRLRLNVGNDVGQMLWESPNRISNIIKTLTSAPEGVIFYGGDHPYIMFFLLPLLLVALGVLLWSWRQVGIVLLNLWVFGVIFAVSMLIPTFESPRILVITGGLMIMCALGLTVLLRILTVGRPRLFHILTIGSVLLIGGLQTAYYFGIHIERFTRQHYHLRPEQEVIFHLRDMPSPNAHLIASKDFYRDHIPTLSRIYTPGVQLTVPDISDLQRYIDELPFDENDAFYLIDNDVAAYYLLQKRFDLSEPVRWHNPYAQDSGIEYIIYYALADRRAVTP